MTDRTKIMLSALAGATGGAMAGYLWLTKSGGDVRAKLPVLEDVIGFVGRARKIEHVGVDALLRLQARAKDEPDLLAALR